jgi:NADH-quinone oxidoreductase subunit L
MSLFAAAMLGLIVANSLLLFFICWELVGLASYLLIGFWFHKPEAAAAAKKAFITTRIGDLGLLIGMLWLYDATGTLLFFDGGKGCLEPAAIAALTAPTAIGLLIFCGAVGKSGQFPLHVWLPDAMEGPTPVSALIHAATMVAAGVFLMARVFPILTDNALAVIAFIGAITALLGAVIAVAQFDIKRVLAFSTVSQLGYMMLAIGVGSWVAAIFHLLTHAFFKALLFLGAGSVIHASHHEQDIRNLGGLAKTMKVTVITFAVGTMALAGVWPMSGFWSKEAILHAAHAPDVSHIPFYAGFVAVVLTAFYMTRLVCEVFFGRSRRGHEADGHTHAEHDRLVTSGATAHEAHESPAVMTVPLVLLAICAAVLGFLGMPAHPWLQQMLDPTVKAEHGSPGLMALSIGLVLVGISLGWLTYGRRPRVSAEAKDPVEANAPRLFAALAARLGFDEFYAATVFRLNAAAAALADWFDRWIWGGAVRGLGAFSEFFAVTNRQFDEGAINSGFDGASESLRGTGKVYSRAQVGEAHGYLRGIAMAFVVLALLVVMGGGQ